MLDKILNFISGGSIGAVLETAVDRLIPDPALKAQVQLAVQKAADDHQEKLAALVNEASAEQNRRDAEAQSAFDRRIADLEGTASDLKAVPILGQLMLFVRGAQRPLWGIGTGFMDVMVFSNQWHLPDEGPQPMAFWTINFLVLGFLFGERAIANILPLVIQFMQARAPAK